MRLAHRSGTAAPVRRRRSSPCLSLGFAHTVLDALVDIHRSRLRELRDRKILECEGKRFAQSSILGELKGRGVAFDRSVKFDGKASNASIDIDVKARRAIGSVMSMTLSLWVRTISKVSVSDDSSMCIPAVELRISPPEARRPHRL